MPALLACSWPRYDPRMNAAPSTATASPCVRMCTLNDEDVCLGCGRTLAEITGWTKLSEPDKAACVQRAGQRLQAMGRPWPNLPEGRSQRHR